MEMHTKQKQILKLLKKEEMTAGRIAQLVKSNYYQVSDWLEELEGLEKVERIKKPKGTYWRKK